MEWCCGACGIKDFGPGDAVRSREEENLDEPQRFLADVMKDVMGLVDGTQYLTFTWRTIEYFALAVAHMVVASLSHDNFPDLPDYKKWVRGTVASASFRREFTDKWDHPSKRYEIVQKRGSQ